MDEVIADFEVAFEYDGKAVNVSGRFGVDFNWVESQYVTIDGEPYEFWDQQSKGFPPEDVLAFEMGIGREVFVRVREMAQSAGSVLPAR
jgi:hypothetical protein